MEKNNQSHIDSSYFLFKNNKKSDSFTWRDLQKKALTGDFLKSDLVCTDSMHTWTPGYQFKEFAFFWKESPLPPNHNKSKSSSAPQSLLSFFKMTILGILKQIPKSIMKKIALFGGILISHTMLSIFFTNSYDHFMKSTLVNKGKVLSGTLFWMFLTSLVYGFYSSIKQNGLAQFINELTSTPSYIINAFNYNKKERYIWLSVGVAFGSFISLLILPKEFSFQSNIIMTSRLAFILLLIIVFHSLSSRENSMIKLFLVLTIKDIQRLLSIQKLKSDQDSNVVKVMTGMMLSFFVVFLVPFLPIAAYGVFAISIGVTLLLIFSKNTQKG